MSDDQEYYIRDAMGRPLNVGDKLIFTNGEPAMFTIVDYKPILHPKAPPGAMVVVLQQTVRLRSMAGAVAPDVVRIQAAGELLPSETGQDQKGSGLALTDLPEGKGKPS